MAGRDRKPTLGGHRLHLDKPADPLTALTSAQTGVFHATHRRIDAAERRGESFVDVHRAALDLASNVPAVLGVTGPDAGVEPVPGIIRTGDRFLIARDGIEADNGSERLLGIAGHLWCHAGEHGRVVEQLTQIPAFPAAGQDPGAPRLSVLDLLTDPLQMITADQAADVMVVVEGAAESQRLGTGHERPAEVFHQAVVDIDPLDRYTQLAAIGETGANRPFCRSLDICVGQYQHRVLSTQLQRTTDQPIGAAGSDHPAGRCGTGEADVVAHVYQLWTYHVARPVHDLPQPGGHAALLQQLDRCDADKGSLLSRFGDHGVT